MPLSASDYQSSLGQNPPGTLSNFNPGEFGDTYNVPVVNQEDTFTVTTGATDTGWSCTILNSTNGETTTFLFDPVELDGTASATTADAARSLRDAWNSNPRALEFGRASLDSASVVRVVYLDDRATYATTFVEAGVGAITVAIAIASSITNIEVGTFAFRPTNALINAGADPLALVAATSATLEQFVGGVARRGSLTNPSFDSTLTYPVYGPSRNVPVAQRARMAIRAAVAVRVTDPPAAVTTASAGVRVGWLTTGAGLVLTSGVKIVQGAPAAGIAIVEFSLA
jgi:hypothetical protein